MTSSRPPSLRSRSASTGGVAVVQGQAITGDGPAGKLAAVTAVGVHQAVGGRDDQLVAVVAVEVGEDRRCRAVARQLLRPARQQILVVVQVEVAAVLTGE